MLRILVLNLYALISVNAYADFETIETQLINHESKYTDIVKNTEKHIRWYQGKKQKTELAIVYIHGFSATRQELTPTTERLADLIGANVFYTRLKGHGRSEDAMAEASVEDWKRDATEAYNIGSTIGKRVILVSASTGGTLATWLVAQPTTKNVAANILMSPNFGVRNRVASILLWPGGITLAKWINDDYRGFTPRSEQQALYWTERYPIEAVVPMLNLVNEVQDIDKSVITVPHMFIYSPRDHVVSVEKIEDTIAEFKPSNPSVIKFESSLDPAQHILSGDICSPNSTDQVIELMETFLTELDLI